MPKKNKRADNNSFVEEHAPIIPQPITETIEKNYMPYVMSVIISRAIPEIDGFKPAHRKLLYTMYKMGLLTGGRTKSANVVGQTMKLNPHGDASIYETMVRLTRGNASLLYPFIDSKGSFGKQYSSDMKYAAARYTEVKLDSFCNEIFKGIDKDAVDLVDNYDNTMKEPVLLPTTFPNVLVTPNTGIAVGMASSICPFNLSEICDGTIALLKNPKTTTEKLMEIIKAPDFPGGGTIIYEPEEIKNVYETGQGSIRIRSRYKYDKDANCIDIIEIPYSTSIEIIMKKITELVKTGKIKEIVDLRDEIDLSGFKLTLDLRRGVDPEKLMKKLFKTTPLEDCFKCNFNILVNSVPRQMGVKEILSEWIVFRMQCLSRELTFDCNKKKDKLHLLRGLSKILIDIDKAISIIRGTQHEADVVPNLMKGFSIDEIQAEYVADIKLRNLNREYILNRISEVEALQQEIAEIEEILADELKLKALIAKQLNEIKKKDYGKKPRTSQILYSQEIDDTDYEEPVENYNVRIYMSKEGYFKKITPLSLRGNDEQKLKEGDSIIFEEDAENKNELIFFTNQCQVYRAKLADFENVKASLMGDYLPSKLGMSPNEKPIFMHIQDTYPPEDNMIFIFENGKGVKVPITAYQTKGARRKLIGAFSNASPIVGIFYEHEPFDILISSSAGRAIIVKSTLIPLKSTRTSSGVAIMTLKKGVKVTSVCKYIPTLHENAKGCRKLKIPAVGVPLSDNSDDSSQLTIDV